MIKYKKGTKFSYTRIKLTTNSIAQYSGITPDSLRKAIYRGTIDLNNKSMWTRFWSLVEYLEKKGLRPNKE